ncbi:MAG: hypothetical protein IPI92_20125 [Gemmatimonadetes bacterium]|nr:hypothetical protein [Gemmatimonadota bacterium]
MVFGFIGYTPTPKNSAEISDSSPNALHFAATSPMESKHLPLPMQPTAVSKPLRQQGPSVIAAAKTVARSAICGGGDFLPFDNFGSYCFGGHGSTLQFCDVPPKSGEDTALVFSDRLAVRKNSGSAIAVQLASDVGAGSADGCLDAGSFPRSIQEAGIVAGGPCYFAHFVFLIAALAGRVGYYSFHSTHCETISSPYWSRYQSHSEVSKALIPASVMASPPSRPRFVAVHVECCFVGRFATPDEHDAALARLDAPRAGHPFGDALVVFDGGLKGLFGLCCLAWLVDGSMSFSFCVVCRYG